jgi:hypothetical protein
VDALLRMRTIINGIPRVLGIAILVSHLQFIGNAVTARHYTERLRTG